MNERIKKLADWVLTNDLYPEVVQVENDPFDEKQGEAICIAKRICDFLKVQKITLLPESELIGANRFSPNNCPGDIFTRAGHAAFYEAVARYYKKPLDNLSLFEWQHSNADFGKLIRLGLSGYIKEINESRKNHLGEYEKLRFLAAMEMVIGGIIRRAEQYRDFCNAEAEKCTDEKRKATLLRMAKNINNVPRNPAQSFEEAIQSIYYCFGFLPDSLGRPDQYLYSLYMQGIKDGTLTQEHAKELLQELFCKIYRLTALTSANNDRGAECHFVIGGYTIDHEDGYNELSDLILESLMELPTVRPQLSLRWNKKTPYQVLRKVLDYERKDKLKRIALVNDEPRIDCIMNIIGHPWEIAYDYIMVGCNEPAFQGGISLGGNTSNVVRSLINTLNKRRPEIVKCQTYEEFHAIFKQELHHDLEEMLEYTNRFNAIRSGDCNVMSSIFLHGCIERAESATRGGAKLARGGGQNLMGGTTLIDSLSIIKQFIYDEKRITWQELLKALDEDWKDAEELRQTILREGKFFGNNDEHTNAIAQQFHRDIYEFAQGRTDMFGTPLTYGNLTGYNHHFATYGSLTQATPDGRVAGSALTFGSGQSFGKDKDGATSHLLSVAKMDPTGIMAGNTIMNLTVDEKTLTDDDTFEKMVLMIETYFKAGGLHMQLNHVAREDLIAAQQKPDEYKSLRVRVSGFSATFVTLNEAMQQNVIDRTVN